MDDSPQFREYFLQRIKNASPLEKTRLQQPIKDFVNYGSQEREQLFHSLMPLFELTSQLLSEPIDVDFVLLIQREAKLFNKDSVRSALAKLSQESRDTLVRKTAGEALKAMERLKKDPN